MIAMKTPFKSIASIVFLSLIISACNKDETNEPQNVETYNGITDQDMTVKYQTGELDGKLFLISYDLTVIYAYQQGMATQELKKYDSEGIIQINNKQFDLDLGSATNYLNGNFSDQMDSLTGQYSYKFTEHDTVISGQFWTLKE